MFKIKCRCGNNEKNFKNDIGEFYVDTCCEKAGYDCFGEKEEIEAPQEPEGVVEIEEEIEEEIEISPEPEIEIPEEVANLNKALENADPVGDGDLDDDGDVDAADVALSAKLENMGQAELKEVCDALKIEYKKNESKKNLRLMIRKHIPAKDE